MVKIKSYVINLVGNRTKRTINKPSTTFVDHVFATIYDVNDRIQTETLDNGVNGVGIDQTTTYTWNATKQSSKVVVIPTTSTVTQAFSYNLQGYLASAITETKNGSNAVTSRTQVEYQYDPLGIRRLSMESTDSNLATPAFDKVVGNKTEYLIDHTNMTGYAQTVIETTKNSSDQVIKRITYTFGTDELTQNVVTLNPTTQAILTQVTHSFGHDGLTNVRVLFDASAAINQVYMFAAYGQLLAIHNLQSNVVGIIGQANLESLANTSMLADGESFDTRIGQRYLRARWQRDNLFLTYDPFAGNPLDPLVVKKVSATVY